PELPSFPTRRSSDLVPMEKFHGMDSRHSFRRASQSSGSGPSVSMPRPMYLYHQTLKSVGLCQKFGADLPGTPPYSQPHPMVQNRSEEHTSELQSREK